MTTKIGHPAPYAHQAHAYQRAVEHHRQAAFHEHLSVTSDRRLDRLTSGPVPFATRLRALNDELSRAERQADSAAPPREPTRAQRAEPDRYPGAMERRDVPRLGDVDMPEPPQIDRRVRVTYHVEAFLPRAGVLDLFI